jgi:alkanesulfonate monooxygenase SsuD/methylene tetrahydromethanopterin reductase-like flavin-dependent oxidoreductase (luciferase family)
MVEGQEGVSWEQWLALARACEESGLEGLFRSDHYLSIVRGGNAGSSTPGRHSPLSRPGPSGSGSARSSRL